MRAAIYLRISRDHEGKAAGVKRQERDCRELCERHGWAVAAILQDNDVSAFSKKRRKGYEALLTGLVNHEFDAVVAWAPDRLTRNLTELEALVKVIELAGADVATVHGGRVDLTTAGGRFQAGMLGQVAKYESDIKSERLKAKHAELARAGRYGGGPRPYGWKKGGVQPEPTEQRIIKEIVKRTLKGEALRSIMVDLNARGIKSATGKTWSRASLRRLLLSPRLCGQRQHLGKLTKAEWRPVITRAEHRKLTALLTAPERRQTRAPRVGWAASLLVCGKCGSRMASSRQPRANGTSVRRYVCDGDTCWNGVIAEKLEELVLERVVKRMDDPHVTTFVRERVADDGTEQVEVLEARLVELAEEFASGDLDRLSWATARTVIEEQLVLARAAVVERHGSSLFAWDESSVTPNFVIDAGAGTRMAEEFPSLSIEGKRDTIGRVVESVTVSPGARRSPVFDPGRVRVKFRPSFIPTPIIGTPKKGQKIERNADGQLLLPKRSRSKKA